MVRLNFFTLLLTKEMHKILIALGLIVLTISFMEVNTAFAISGFKIRCNIDGAEVHIDNKFKGECPLTAKIRAGKHKIIIRKELDDGSFYYYEKIAKIGEDVTQEINAELKRVYTEEY